MADARLTVPVTIEPGQGLSGSVVASTGDEALAFSGWLGLVEAINLLRQRAGQVSAAPAVVAGHRADRPGADRPGAEARRRGAALSPLLAPKAAGGPTPPGSCHT